MTHFVAPIPEMLQVVRGVLSAITHIVGFIDIRGQQKDRPDLYKKDDYRASQAFGVGLRWPASGAG